MERILSVGSHLPRWVLGLAPSTEPWPQLEISFPWKSIWKPKVPSRVSFFLWVASLGKIFKKKIFQKKKKKTLFW